MCPGTESGLKKNRAGRGSGWWDLRIPGYLVVESVVREEGIEVRLLGAEILKQENIALWITFVSVD